MRVSKTMGWLVICFAIESPVLAWAAEPSTTGALPDASGEIRAIFSDLEERAVTAEEALKGLKALPSEEAIPALVEELGTNPLLNSSRAKGRRILAYQALEAHGAVQTDAGYGQFAACLDEPGSPRGLCVAALLDAPERRQPEVIQRVSQFLGDPRIEDSAKRTALRAISAKGPSAAAYLEPFLVVFASQTAGEHVRCAAASAILNVGGLKRILPQLQGLDARNEKVTLWALAKFIGQEFDRYQGDLPTEFREALVQVRQFVLKGLKSEDLQVRSAAFEALPLSFGEELVIEESPGDYRINPEFEAAIKELATGEADPGLRERAQGAVGQFDDLVRAVLRRRERRASQDSGATPTKSDQDDPAPVVAPQEQPEPGP